MQKHPLDTFFSPASIALIGASRDGHTGQVVNLNVRRKIAEVELPGPEHFTTVAEGTELGRS